MERKSSLFQIALMSLIALCVFVGCASIIGKGGAEILNIRSTPEQATVAVADESGAKIFEGKTPTTVPLEKKKGYFSGKTYTVTISMSGFADKVIVVDTKTNGWYLGGNIIFGGLIGWFIVDPLTGAMWTLDTNELNVALEPSKRGSLIRPDELGVVLLQDVPLTLRDRLVPVRP